MNGTMTGMGLSGLVAVLAVLALLGLAVGGGIWLYRRPSGGRADKYATVDRDAATGRLRERYAAGEIDDEEYERRLSALTFWH